MARRDLLSITSCGMYAIWFLAALRVTRLGMRPMQRGKRTNWLLFTFKYLHAVIWSRFSGNTCS